MTDANQHATCSSTAYKFTRSAAAGATIGGLTRASGSAVLQLGSTHVAVAVHGPKPADGRAALADTGQVIATVEFAAFAGAPPKPLARVRLC